MRFAGEVFIHSLLIVATQIFSFVGIDIETFVVECALVFGGCAALVVAAFLAEREMGRMESIAPRARQMRYLPIYAVVPDQDGSEALKGSRISADTSEIYPFVSSRKGPRMKPNVAKRVTAIVLMTLLLMLGLAAVAVAGPADSALSPGPSTQAGDGISDGTSLAPPYGIGLGGAPNSGDGVSDGSGF